MYGELEDVRSDTLVLRVLSVESSRGQPQLPDEAFTVADPRPESTNSLLIGAPMAVVRPALAVAGTKPLDVVTPSTPCWGMNRPIGLVSPP